MAMTSVVHSMPIGSAISAITELDVEIITSASPERSMAMARA